MPTVVVLDPGHGGGAVVGGSSPNNATGPTGLAEKDLTLDLALRVRDRLTTVATVMMTRSADVNVGLADRAHMAQINNARAFVSIHMNGDGNPATDGSEAYVGRAATAESRLLAQSVLLRVVNATGVRNRGVHDADFGMIRADRHLPTTAATLVEVAFLSNPAQETHLRDMAYRDQIAQGIADGIRDYLQRGSMVAHSHGYDGGFAADPHANGDGDGQDWGYAFPPSYGLQVSAEIQAQWDARPGVHHYFRNDVEYYGTMVPAFAARGIANAAQYMEANMMPGSFFGTRTTMHRRMAAALQNTERSLTAAGFTPHWSDFNCLNVRLQRTGNRLSKHAVGLAIDIDPRSNPLIQSADVFDVLAAATGIRVIACSDPAELRRASDLFRTRFTPDWVSAQTDAVLTGKITRSRAALNEYAQRGFCTLDERLIRGLIAGGLGWGGAWTSYKDFMHFELDGWT